MTRRLALLILAVSFLLLAGEAEANCTGPSAIAGTIIFNTTYNVMQYCDGTNWINMGGVASNTAAAGSTGAVQFNTSNALDADSSYFIWDKTNHRLGVGSATPGSALDVKGTIRLSGVTSGYVGLAPAAAAGSTTYTLPSSDGSSGQFLYTNGSGTLAWGTPSGTGLSSTLTSGYVFVGNGSNVATGVAISGDITITNAGVTAIGSAKVTNSMLAGSIDLTSKVTGALPVANGGTGTATAFTAGSVVYAGASGVYGQDNSNFFWDSTNHRLGIGTATPSTPLHVNGASTLGGAVSATSTITGATGVGIGTTNVASTALLDLVSTSKGLLPPRMTETTARTKHSADHAAGVLEPEPVESTPLLAARSVIPYVHQGDDGAQQERNAYSSASGRADPRAVIAAALKAAGLLGQPTDNPIDPRRVIASTLRAAGVLG
jgi:hypothetical protein